MGCINENYATYTAKIIFSSTFPLALSLACLLAYRMRRKQAMGNPVKEAVIFQEHASFFFILIYLVLPTTSQIQFQGLDCKVGCRSASNPANHPFNTVHHFSSNHRPPPAAHHPPTHHQPPSITSLSTTGSRTCEPTRPLSARPNRRIVHSEHYCLLTFRSYVCTRSVVGSILGSLRVLPQ